MVGGGGPGFRLSALWGRAVALRRGVALVRRWPGALRRGLAPVRRWHAAPLLGLVLVCAWLVPADVPGHARAAVKPPVKASRAAARVPAPTRVLFVGASITRGWFATTRSESYPMVLDRLLQSRGQRVQPTVIARSGAEAGETLAWALPPAQDVVVVQVATNDFMHGVPLASFQASYGALLDRVRATSPRADLACLGTWEPPGNTNRLGLTATDYDVAVRSSCQQRLGTFVPLAPVFTKAGSRGPAGQMTQFGPADTFHPNDMGQVLIAGEVLAGLDREPANGSSPPAQLAQAGPARRWGG